MINLGTINDQCINKEIFDINNIYGQKNISNKNQNGIWYKSSSHPTKDDFSDYIYVKKSDSECTTSRKQLEGKIKELTQRLEEVESKYEDMKLKESYSIYDNIMCDCVTSFYNLIVDKVNLEHTDVNTWSWKSLNRVAKYNSTVSSYITSARKSFNITDLQWEEITNFKQTRNINSHGYKSSKDNANKTLEILVNYVDDDFCSKELKTGLMLVAEAVLESC